MARETEYGRHIRERVEAGPVKWSVLVAEAADLVHPGAAFRNALRRIEHNRELAGTAGRNYTDQERKKDQRIRYGQRGFITGTLNSLEERGRIEYYEQDGERWVRLGPHPWTDPIRLAPHMTPYAKAVLQLVEDDCHLYDEVFEVVKDLIPPEHAIARARATREGNRSRRGSSNDTQYSEEVDREVGSRTLFTTAMLNLKKSARIVIEGSGKNRTIGRGPAWLNPR